MLQAAQAKAMTAHDRIAEILKTPRFLLETGFMEVMPVEVERSGKNAPFPMGFDVLQTVITRNVYLPSANRTRDA